LDLNDDGILDILPWTVINSGVALIEEPNPPAGTEYEYATSLGLPVVGPDGTFVPGHVALINGVWQIGNFDPANPAALDSPGSANSAPNFTYIWLLTQDNSGTGGTAYDIILSQPGANSAPYGTIFSGIAPGEYCVHGM